MNLDNIKKTSQQLDDKEQEYVETHYPTSKVYKSLGITRDTLRYYEDLGLFLPNKDKENSYRQYSADDIMDIMTIDFYKKRGISPLELKKVKESNCPGKYKELLLNKKAH